MDGSQSTRATPVRAEHFAARDRPNVRTAKPWHRYAHHIRELPAALERLAPELRVPPGGRVLDYGCAEAPYRRFFAADVAFVGADLPGNPHAAVVLDPDGRVPLPDGSFDAVLSTQVLEHVTDPARYLSESFRLLRPGGRLLLSTHGTFVYHPDPQDLWRWTSAGLRRVVADAGYRIVRFEGVVGIGATGVQLIEDSLYHHVPPRWRSAAALVFESAIRALDRLADDESRRQNAQVYVLVAEKP